VARIRKKLIYNLLIGKSKGKKPLGRSRLRWEDNIKTDFTVAGGGGMEEIEQVQVEVRALETSSHI
jgi:hypothetical protein